MSYHTKAVQVPLAHMYDDQSESIKKILFCKCLHDMGKEVGTATHTCTVHLNDDLNFQIAPIHSEMYLQTI